MANPMTDYDNESLLDRGHLIHTISAQPPDTPCHPTYLHMRVSGDTFTPEEADVVCRYVDKLQQLVQAGTFKKATCVVCRWEWFTTRVGLRGRELRCETCRVV